MNGLLFFVWCFFSLPWIIITSIIHSLVHSDGGRRAAAASAEAAFKYELDCFLLILGMPLAFGAVLFLVSLLVPEKNKGVQMAGSIFGFGTIVRVFLFLLFGGSLMGWQLASQNQSLASYSKSFYFGANIGWFVGLPLLIFGFISLVRMLPKGEEGENKAAGFFGTWFGWYFTMKKGWEIAKRNAGVVPVENPPAVTE